MGRNELSRRNFIGKTATGVLGVAVSSSGLSMNTASHQRIKGANDRTNIGFLGCGSRSRGHQNMVKTSEKDKNLAVVAVCDIWKLNREKAAANCKRLFGTDAKQFKYSEDMLVMPGLDAVMIATGDFQHAKLARSAVLGSKQVVQMGSQWVSDPMQIKVREIVRSGTCDLRGYKIIILIFSQLCK